jgi:hypothetical protein
MLASDSADLNLLHTDRRREFAIALGLPTMRAFARWDEAFAEVGAHLVLDWTADGSARELAKGLVPTLARCGESKARFLRFRDRSTA